MGIEIAALTSFFGLTGAFALVGTVLAAWMAWRIVEKAGLPGWTGLGAILLTLTGVGTIVPLILLWIFAFMRWPRDEAGPVGPAGSFGYAPPRGGAPTTGPVVLSGPPMALPDARGWRLSGALGNGGTVSLAIGGNTGTYALTGAPAGAPTDLSVPDPSVGRPHARLMLSGQRLGLEDLGSPGGTFLDGARLLPEHGPRDISAVRSIRLGSVELSLTRA
ncbi:FHA domain-containing protein [Reyranella sp.]|uniref:FHA domain-containing protein n=1 Tax=Reyranella sp. TaxID=1929291 RepID=UPI003BAC6546